MLAYSLSKTRCFWILAETSCLWIIIMGIQRLCQKWLGWFSRC